MTALEGLSAEQGSSMSICARVLAAALMAGAIAAVVAFPARFGPGGEPGRVIVAPPSSQQRAIHLPALPAPRRHAALVVIHVTNRTTAPVRTIEQAVVATSRPQATRPPVKVAPTDTTRTLAAVTPAQAPPTPAPAPPVPAAPKQHGRGHAFGHLKPHGKPQAPVAPTPVAPTPPPAATPAADESDQPPTDADGSDQGNGHAHAYGHDK